MNKNFKTKIAAGLLAASTAVSASVPAFAAGVDSLYDKIFKSDNSIDIVYNGEVLTYTDAQPQNINDRVMIPFRAVLETMGASVEYNEAARVVTAVRGDTKITFSLDSNVIDIDKNGTKSQLVMDVPMAVVNDRTLVPIRFMSNALGMNVGWEGSLNTVVILDSEAYINELKTLPNFGKMMTIKSAMPAVQNGAFTIAMDFASTSTAAPDSNAAFDFKFDTAYDVVCKDGVVGGKAALNLDIDGLNSMINQLSEQKISLKNIENANIDVVADDGVLYFKTDLIEKLAAAYPDVKEIQSVAKFADKNTWFKWDMEATFTKLAEEDQSFKPLADLIKNGITGMNSMNGEDAFRIVAAREGDVSLTDVMAIESAMQVYKFMDSYMNVTVADNGDYEMSMNITKDILTKIFNELGLNTTDSEFKQVMDAITLDIKAESKLKDGKTSSLVDYKIGVNYAEESESLKINLSLTATSTGDMNGKAEAPSVPKSALDVMDIAALLK